MSIPVLILGESGTGKSRSMKHCDPANTLLIQAIHKPLPFKAEGWSLFSEENKKGNIFVTDRATDVTNIIRATRRKVIIIDDFQYILANELMRRFNEKGYDKFTEIGYNGWNIITQASQLAPDVRVYILAHSHIDENGKTKIKTPGKLLDTYSVEGMFSLVLRTLVRDGEYFLSTRNNGNDTVKTPEGMFTDDLIPNDIQLIEEAMKQYGWF